MMEYLGHDAQHRCSILRMSNHVYENMIVLARKLDVTEDHIEPCFTWFDALVSGLSSMEPVDLLHSIELIGKSDAATEEISLSIAQLKAAIENE